METTAIKVDNVSMRFRLPTQKVDTIKEYFIKTIKREITYTDFYALKNISFEIRKGERIGIIGRNGAGKSTILKIISNVMKPTEGNVVVNGQIAPLLELGAGFDHEFSGRENIYFNSAILGKNKKFIENRENDIVKFAELGEFIDVPVKNYSSGMRAKLGFSIATQIDPEILILDEILGVGDFKFQQKSELKMLEMINSGNTVIIVSHDLNTLMELTDKVIWLENGRLKAFGDSKIICKEYLEM